MTTTTLERRSGRLELTPAARKLAEASISARTRRLYRRELDRVAADCQPLTDATLADHLARRFQDGAAPSTLSLTVSALRFAAKVAGRTSPDGPATERVLAGSRREGRTRGRGQVQGLTWSQADVAAAVAANGGASWSGLRDAALISLQSDALLRVSELTALDRADISREPDGSGRLAIHFSKTDPEGQGATLYLRRVTMARIQAWTEAAKISAGPLFRRVFKGDQSTGSDPLTAAAVRSILKRRVAAAGFDPSKVSGHSCRVGAAQSLVRRGATVSELKQVGRWKTARMPTHYARAELAGRSAVARLRDDNAA